MKKEKRQSGIEMLKLMAIVMIVFSHAMPCNFVGTSEFPDWYMDLTLATESIQRFVIVLFKYSGQVGNIIFIVCSAWFLAESKKLNLKKIFYMVCDSFVISVFFMGGGYWVAGTELTGEEIIRQFFPVLFKNNWFVCCYICFYMLHPAINHVFERLNKAEMLTVALIYFGVYSVLAIIIRSAFFYNQLIGFIMVYTVVAYMKKYTPKFCDNFKLNTLFLCASISSLILLILFTNYLGLHIRFFSNKLTYWSDFNNPLIVLIGITSFNMVKNIRFVNKKVNYLSGMSLLIYIIHDNRIILDHIKGHIFNFIYNKYTYQYELAWVCLNAVGLLIFGVMAAAIYRNTLQKLVRKAADKIYPLLENLYGVVMNICLKID